MNRVEIAHDRRRSCNSVRILFEQMQSAGLYSYTTFWSSVGIERMVEEVRLKLETYLQAKQKDRVLRSDEHVGIRQTTSGHR